MEEMWLNSDAQVETGCRGNKLEMSKQDELGCFVPKWKVDSFCTEAPLFTWR